MRVSALYFYFIIGSAIVLSSCQKDQILDDVKGLFKSDKDNTYKGPQVQVGNGQANTFVTISHSGVPKKIGVVFTEGALSGLPTANTIYPLEFHHKALEATLFEHVALGWSATGHGLPPSGQIGPHMDVRFFMMTQEERLAIPAPPAPEFDVAPPTGYLPANYSLNAAVSQIGRHWGENIFEAGMTVPHTMILGTWNGQLTFINPIVTLTTLASGARYSVAYPQQQYFAKNGYYPTKYNIYEDDKGSHYVSLSHFVWR
ncbi:MAG: DUF5602 domain-containing protein [Chitinophagaceae bacterium]